MFNFDKYDFKSKDNFFTKTTNPSTSTANSFEDFALGVNVVEEAADVFEGASSVVEEAADVFEGASSVVEEAADVFEEASSVVEDPETAVVEESQEVIEETAAVVEEASSVVEEPEEVVAVAVAAASVEAPTSPVKNAEKKRHNVLEIPAVLPKGWYLPGALLVALDALLDNGDLAETARKAGDALLATKKNGPENHDVAFASLVGGVENGRVSSKGYEFLGELYGLYAELL